MKYFFDEWEKLKPFLKGSFIFLFFDFDGTLVPIAGHPQDALLSLKTKRVLLQLKSHSKFRLALISGRSLRDLQRKVGLKGIIYSGNHGLELKAKGISFKTPVAKSTLKFLNVFYYQLLNQFKNIKGVVIENKKYSLSLHYRLVRKGPKQTLKRAFLSLIKPYCGSKKVKIKQGKEVFEIRPIVRWDKGEVIKWILKYLPQYFPIYVGDDITDEDAFKVVNQKRGLSIFVGSKYKRSKAKYYLKNTKDVYQFLKRFVTLGVNYESKL